MGSEHHIMVQGNAMNAKIQIKFQLVLVFLTLLGRGYTNRHFQNWGKIISFWGID